MSFIIPLYHIFAMRTSSKKHQSSRLGQAGRAAFRFAELFSQATGPEPEDSNLLECAEKVLAIENAYDTPTQPNHEALLAVPISELNPSEDLRKVLMRNGINVVGDLAPFSRDNFMRMPKLGRKKLDELVNKLEGIGIQVQNEEQD